MNTYDSIYKNINFNHIDGHVHMNEEEIEDKVQKLLREIIETDEKMWVEEIDEMSCI